MPMLHRVVYECSTEDSLSNVRQCLTAFAGEQLTKPHPGTAVYHFTRPKPKEQPLRMEFTEIYQDDEVFWKHIDPAT